MALFSKPRNWQADQHSGYGHSMAMVKSHLVKKILPELHSGHLKNEESSI